MQLNDFKDKSTLAFLYMIMKKYISGEINVREFCDEFYLSFSLELKYDSLSDKELELLTHLSEIVSRFNYIEEDILKYPKAYANEVEVRHAVELFFRALER